MSTAALAIIVMFNYARAPPIHQLRGRSGAALGDLPARFGDVVTAHKSHRPTRHWNLAASRVL